MDANNIINKLSLELNIPDLRFSDEGVVTLSINDEFTTNIEKTADDRSIIVYGVVGELPPLDREAHLMELLTGNMFGLHTEGATLAVDPNTDEIILFKVYDVHHLHFEDFYRDLQIFFSVQKEWMNKVESREYVYVPMRLHPY